MNGGGGTHFRGRMIARSNGLALGDWAEGGKDHAKRCQRLRGWEALQSMHQAKNVSQMTPSQGLDPLPITFPLTFRPRCPLSLSLSAAELRWEGGGCARAPSRVEIDESDTCLQRDSILEIGEKVIEITLCLVPHFQLQDRKHCDLNTLIVNRITI